MLRKFAFVAAAIASLGLAALASSPASAQGHHGGYRGHWGGHHHWGGPRFGYRPHFRPYAFAYRGSCIRTRWVPTPWGPRLRRVNVCY